MPYSRHSSHNARFQTLFQDAKSAMAKVDQAVGAIARDVERTREYASRDMLTARLYRDAGLQKYVIMKPAILMVHCDLILFFRMK